MFYIDLYYVLPVLYYRHHDFRRCSTGMLAMNLFVRFHSATYEELNFVDSSTRTRGVQVQGSIPAWQKLKLVQNWGTTRSADAAYRSVLSATNLSWQKVTHMRLDGIERASCQGGMSGEQVATMSGHRHEKVFRYLTSLYPPLMKVMSGVDKDSPYDVDRTELEPIWGSRLGRDQHERMSAQEIREFYKEFSGRHKYWVLVLFPQFRRWVEEHKSDFGDKSKAASNFLRKVIPYLTHVILTDAPFWIQNYPNHEVSRLLRAVLPPDYHDR